jgi:subtilisin family serine protease
MKSTFLIAATIACLLGGLSGCSPQKTIPPLSMPTLAPFPTPNNDRRPPAANYSRGKLEAMNSFDPAVGDPFQVDLRSSDLTGLDLRASAGQLRYAIFDDQTAWPPSDRLPSGYDWKQVMEIGKNPGLGLRSLHDQGITGSGVGIAILDQPLLVDHPEYRDRLRLYEEINVNPNMPAQMHGPAVASLAVGKTTGVAPGADLYFLADWFSDPDEQTNFVYLAQGILRVLEINASLPEGHKIRVISISRGYNPQDKGYAELMTAIRRAEKEGLAVISVGMFGSRPKAIQGLGRDPLADPDQAASYTASAFMIPYLDRLNGSQETLWVPIDDRTTASPTGEQDYAFYGVGGMSWAEPYLAGVYALVCQVDPKMTPARFWKLALETGSYVTVTHNGKQVKIGPMINPPGLIERVKS